MRSAFLPIWLVLACLLAAAGRGGTATAASGRPMPPAARLLLERGASHYAAGRYQEAARTLREGYHRYGHPDFLYALGQAERRAGRCAAAIAAYQEFLRHDPPLREATHALVNIERCKAELAQRGSASRPASGAARSVAPPVSSAPARAAAGAPPPAPPRRPSYRDPAGGLLAATALACLTAGLVTMVLADAQVSEANQAQVYREREEALQRRDGYRVAGIVTLSVGTVAAAASLLRFIQVARRGRVAARQSAGVVGWAGGAGAGLGLQGRW